VAIHTAQVGAIAARLFDGVMAPLVLGGGIAPGRPIATLTQGALEELATRGTATLDQDRVTRVDLARLRRARMLAPVDSLAPPAAAEWALAAALHDIVQSTNPGLCTPLRRRAAVRTLEIGQETVACAGPPRNVREALSRHTWLARLLEIARTDTVVSWWAGSRAFLGVEPPPRIRAWPALRRVKVEPSRSALLSVSPLAFDGAHLGQAMAGLLAATPLTDLATCARVLPRFAWSDASAGLVAHPTGRALAVRALGRSSREAVDGVDAALGHATLAVVGKRPDVVRAAAALLAERSLQRALERALPGSPFSDAHTRSPARGSDAAFARSLGAAAALRIVVGSRTSWSGPEREWLLAALGPEAGDAEAVLASL
jgi:hypothetical protein